MTSQAKVIAAIVAVVLLLAGLGLGYYFVIYRPAKAQDDVALSKAETTVAKAAPAIAKETLKEVERYSETRVEIRDITAKGTAGILAAEGASSNIPAGVAAAGRRALCLHEVNRDDPACTEVSGLRAGRDVGKDAGSLSPIY